MSAWQKSSHNECRWMDGNAEANPERADRDDLEVYCEVWFYALGRNWWSLSPNSGSVKVNKKDTFIFYLKSYPACSAVSIQTNIYVAKFKANSVSRSWCRSARGVRRLSSFKLPHV